jgi:hypothetical protein
MGGMMLQVSWRQEGWQKELRVFQLRMTAMPGCAVPAKKVDRRRGILAGGSSENLELPGGTVEREGERGE